MAKRQQARGVRGEPKSGAKRRGSRRPNVPIESVQNEEHPLPAKVAAVFDDFLSRSVRAAHADHVLQAKVAVATAKFRREQGRLVDSLAKQLGVSATVKELETLRERHIKTVAEAMESASAAVRGARSDAG